MYVKFFDVVWNASANQATPIAMIRFNDLLPRQIEMVPAVYITDESLKKTAVENIPSLAENISELISKLSDHSGISFSEFQTDCDWTATTKSKYFQLIESLKKKFSEKKILFSATIRLHQIKYAEQTGIPPVDRGMLMFYNMGDLIDPSTVNSIFDSSVAAKYVSRIKDYPLPLDVALAVFTWGVHLRKGRVINLDDNLKMSEVNTSRLFMHLHENTYATSQSFFFHGDYFIEGDLLRMEEISPAICEEAAKMVAPRIQNDYLSLAFFHFDESNLSRYSSQDFNRICNAFH
ncbi:MAG TPA: hypothetical protein VE978_16695 [Chitinophagales bacterium]|nr:hypothetical protein [Chitinophagales bacterium]